MTLDKLQTIQAKIEYCLERYPETRNSDIVLFTRLLENFYPPFEHPIYNWRDLVSVMNSTVSLDHVARCRRKAIQASEYKKWLPTSQAVAEARGINGVIWHDYARNNSIRSESSFQSNIPVTHNDNGDLK